MAPLARDAVATHVIGETANGMPDHVGARVICICRS
jgi:hypothetical protein